MEIKTFYTTPRVECMTLWSTENILSGSCQNAGTTPFEEENEDYTI